QTAKDLYRSQSALSRHIQALEADFGAPLLIRTGNAVELTPEGEVVKDLAATIVRKYDYVKRAFAPHEDHRNTLVIGGHIDAPEDIRGFLQAVERFNSASGDLQVRFEPFDSVSIRAFREKLISGEADILFLFGDVSEMFEGEDRLACRVAVTRRWKVFVEDTNPLAEKEYLTLDDLQNQPVMHFVGERYSSSWKILRSFFSEHSIKIKEQLFRTKSLYDYLNAPLGDALLFFPPPNDTLLAVGGRRKILDVRTDEDFSLDLLAVYLKDNKADAINAYIDLVQEELAPHQG
ncbi:MAG: LysR family transcriptional regulator, partial [Eggerthellaceae bacterium]|nr:LysR family transcriptional regulator [Eggerthellaceae bacterium]